MLTDEDKRSKILDGLAWTNIPEDVRVARISSKLVKEMNHALGSCQHQLTQTRVKEAVSETLPPHGRGKAVFEKVLAEYQRQLPIHRKRWRRQDEWKKQLETEGVLDNRRNAAYAARFDRPIYNPRLTCYYNMVRDALREEEPGQPEDVLNVSTWKKMEAIDAAESERDKGDDCIDLVLHNGYTIGLINSANSVRCLQIVMRHKRGPVTRYEIHGERGTLHDINDLLEAAVYLGGPRVKSALVAGKRVVHDWINQKSTIYHDATDIHEAYAETVEWPTLLVV